MSGRCIELGELNRKHLLPLFLALSYLIFLLVQHFYKTESENRIFDLYSNSLGFAGIIIIPYIFKITQKDIPNIPKENEIQRKKYLHYFILIVVFLLYSFAREFPSFYKPKSENTKDDGTGDDSSNTYQSDPFAYIGVEMILLTIVSLFFLKYKYFKHHVISIIGFVICGNVCDLLLGYYSELVKMDPVIIGFKFFSIFIDVIFFNVQKYMMEMLYYPYWKINVVNGVALFCATTIILIYVLIDKDSQAQFILDFYDYFKYNNAGIIIGKLLLTTITYFIFTTLCILNIYYFNPNYFILNFQLSKFVMTLINSEKTERFYCIIFFVLQTFFLLVFLEIIELNFLGLSDNTKRNVELRGLQDLTGENGRDSSIGMDGNIDITSDYYIASIECNKNEPIIEMTRKSD